VELKSGGSAARSKEKADKRETLRRREDQRDMDRLRRRR
jgi:tmRNA-binding protein